MNKNFKAYFIDLDGTLLNTDKDENKYITQTNDDAIQKFAKQGKSIILSTGRLKDFTLYYLKKMNIQYAICGNGAQIIDIKGNVLLQHNINSKSLAMLKTIIYKEDLSIKINQTRKAFNVNSSLAQKIATKLKYKAFTQKKFSWESNVYKMILWGKNEIKLAKIINHINNYVPNVFATSAERGLTIEVTHKNATKGKGNLWVAKNLLKISNPKEDCAHIGDTMNDSSVIDVFKYFIAPINSEKRLLKISPYLGPSHHEDCVARILNGEWWENKKFKTNSKVNKISK